MPRISNGKYERTRYPGVWRKPSGRFEARWSLNGKKHGKTFDTMDQARAHRAKMEEAKRDRTVVDPTRSRTTLAEFAPRFIATKRDLKPSTRNGYEGVMRKRIIPAFGERSLNSIERLDVEEWVSGLVEEGLAASTVRQAYILLNQLLTFAVEVNYLTTNPASKVKPPRVKRTERRYLTADEVGTLAEVTRPDYRALVFVFAYGGLRFGEAAALRRRDCDLLRRRLHVARSASTIKGRIYFTDTKSYKARSVSLPTFVVEELARHLETVPDDPDALVFTAPQGGALHYHNYRRNIWDPATEDAGLDGLTPHELRHTCASLLIAVGADPKSISTHLGHHSVAFTLDTYGHLYDGHMDGSMDALDRAHREAEHAPDNVRRIG